MRKALDEVLDFLGIARHSIEYFKILGGVYLAGGAIISAIDDQKANDLDIFIEDEGIAKILANRLLNIEPIRRNKFTIEFNKDELNDKLIRGNISGDIAACNSELSNSSYLLRYVSKNAFSFKNGIQLIFRFIGEPEEVFTTFDYEHCKVAYKLSAVDSGVIQFLGQSSEAIATRSLIYTGRSRFVCSALSRMIKFSSRGWKLSPQVLLNLLASCLKIDWSSLKAVEEELLGFYSLTPEHVQSVLDELSQKENFSIKEVAELVEGL